jgi:hypothetical protein
MSTFDSPEWISITIDVNEEPVSVPEKTETTLVDNFARNSDSWENI